MNKKIVSFGEIMLRLTPPQNGLIRDTSEFGACYGGSESNVLVCLASLGNETEYLTALPANDLGNAVLRHLHSHNVGTKHILQTGNHLGMYFLEEGFGSRPANVIYNRSYSEVSKLDSGAFHYDSIFEDCSLFHICGISFAISASARRLSFELVKEAKKRNIPVSFDFNYRGKLWSIEEASVVYREIVNDVDYLFCSRRDLDTFLHTGLDDFWENYSCKHLIVRERTVLDNGTHQAQASIYRNHGGTVEQALSAPITFPVLERIGGGDAFAGGVLHILNKNEDNLKEALDYGMACFVLKHTQRGDVFTLGKTAVEAYHHTVKDVHR